MIPSSLHRLAGLFSALVTTVFLAAAPNAAGQAAAASKPATLPPARQIIDRFVKEIGGKEAFLENKSQFVKGTYEMPAQGLKGSLIVYASYPDKLLVKISLAGIGDIETGYDGKVAWAQNAMTGATVMKGKQLEQFKEQADYLNVLHADENFKSMETVEQTEFDGKTCYKLRLVKKSGDEVTEYYEVKTGLLVGFSGPQESELGVLDVKSVLGGYKKFGKFLFATKTTQNLGPIEQVITIDSITFEPIDPKMYKLPASIKALVTLALVAAGVALLREPEARRFDWLRPRDWAIEVAAGALVLASLLWNAQPALSGGLPGPFPWWLFLAGWVPGVLCFVHRWRARPRA